jgi:hypothetical protein
MKKYMPLVLYVWLYAGWFACVGLGKIDKAAYSLFIPCVGWLIFYSIFSLSKFEYLKAFILFLIGICADSVALNLGLIHFNLKAADYFIPVWMISLWILFIPTIFILRKPLGNRLWLAALIGSLLGPISYKSGEYFGVLNFDSFAVTFIYSVFWAIYLPLSIAWVKKT